MRGKKVPQAKRAEAVGLALVKGVPDAAKQLGIPQRSLRRWKNDPELAELGLSAREDVAETMWVAIQVGLDELYAGLTNPKEALKAKADTVAMLLEKRALMVGEPTARTESTLLQGRSDHEQRVLSELIASELERRADADAESVAEADTVAQSAESQPDPA